MREELDQKLVADFPKLFRDRNSSPQDTCFAFGFECGDGWEPLLRRAAEKLEAINNSLANPDEHIVASQVKEKFGTLRFYINGGDDAADAIIREAEEASEVTCEVCGEPGTLRGKYWVYTACDEHTDAKDKT